MQEWEGGTHSLHPGGYDAANGRGGAGGYLNPKH